MELRPSLLPSFLMQEAQCSAQSWAVTLPQVKQEKADAPEEWTAGTAFLTSSTLQPGCPSNVEEVMSVLWVPYKWSVTRIIVSHDGGTGNSDGVLMMTSLLNYPAYLAGAVLSIGN